MDGNDLKPLSRGYTREPDVLADIAALRALPGREFWRRAAITDWQADGCPRMESLVYFLRALSLRGDGDEAWRIAEILTGRVANTVLRRIGRWRSLTVDQREEVESAVTIKLYEEWFSLEPGGEFWEVRFAVCLERTISDEIDRALRIVRNETDLTSWEDDTGDTADAWERIADTPTLDAETTAMIADALACLEEPLRTAFYLYHYEGWPEYSSDPSQPSIAHLLGVTSRSVRNYLRRAEARLAQWRGTEND